jgi:hypothetical protein
MGSMRCFILSVAWLGFLVSGMTQVDALPITLLVDDAHATQPALNDLGEVVYVKIGALFSTTRGLLANNVDAGNVGLANNGEVVYADGSANSQVTSSTRGILASGYGPTIATFPRIKW